MSLKSFLKPGLVWGEDLLKLFEHCKKEGFALPAVNVVGTNSLNAVLESARVVNSPVIIQLSNGGAINYAGKGVKIDNSQRGRINYLGTEVKVNGQEEAILGSISAALHVHSLAEAYGIPVILHTDHCARKLLPWVEGLLAVGAIHKQKFGKPLFSSHMLDLSEESMKTNIETCCEFIKKTSALGMILEIEIGITGGEEDGVDNSHVAHHELFSTPEDIDYVYSQLGAISPMYTIAAAFGNVHGVYKPGNVKLQPSILKKGQDFVKSKHSLSQEKPVSFVFHGGSGSTHQEIKEAVSYGVVKMNIDTDVQWSSWKGVLDYYKTNENRLQSQLGIAGSEDHEAPNKKFYDPRVWLRKSEESIVKRLEIAFDELNAKNRYI